MNREDDKMTPIDKSTPPNAPIIRGTGSTDSERRLAKYADNTFLNLWSYPNPHRFQTTNNRRQCKEICDLLVVCQNHLLIFSDKCVNWSGNDDKESWSRWARKAIMKSKKQLLGAVRWIDKHPTQIYTDNKCTSPLPIDLPSCDSRKLHLILVTQGSEEACKKYYKGNSESFVIRPSVVGSANWDAQQAEFRPFNVGDVNPDGPFIHVFNSKYLSVLMSELDTVVDFTDYLNCRERYLRSSNLLEAHGEINLFTSYILQADERGTHDFPYNPSTSPITIQRGDYEKHKKSKAYQLKKEHNRISYIWDELITKFAAHQLAGTLLGKDRKPVNDIDAEKGLRFMALETRLSRRGYGMAIRTALEGGKKVPIFSRQISISTGDEFDDTIYLVVTSKNKDGAANYDTYLDNRNTILSLFTMEALMMSPHAKRIIGFAFEPSERIEGRAETMIYLEQLEWTHEQREEVLRRLNQRLPNLKVLPLTSYQLEEFPNRDTEPDSDHYSPPSMNRKARRAKTAKTRKKR